MNNDLPSDSDLSDADYMPDESGEMELPSEEDSEGDDEELLSDKTIVKTKQKRKKNGKRKASNKKLKLSTENNCEETQNEAVEEQGKTEEEKKKHEENLWASFLGTTETKPKPKSYVTENRTIETKKVEPKSSTVSVTKVFEFAGEVVKVTKDVPSDSVEARLATSSTNTNESVDVSSNIPKTSSRGRGLGLSAVLGQIGKKNKISTLEKSKLDWDRFKKDSGISNEIENYNKGKDGYLERQDFLQRTDQRQFEIEKELRSTRRSNR